jgi:hypothetical protein
MYLSMGILNALSDVSCSSLFGYPMSIYPLISSSFPLALTTGIISFKERSSSGTTLF